MNKIYSKVWNVTLRQLVVASEFASRRKVVCAAGTAVPPRAHALSWALTVALALGAGLAPWTSAHAQAYVGYEYNGLDYCTKNGGATFLNTCSLWGSAFRTFTGSDVAYLAGMNGTTQGGAWAGNNNAGVWYGNGPDNPGGTGSRVWVYQGNASVQGATVNLLSTNGVNVASQKIHNLAAGTASTDAVNVAQLQAQETHYVSVNDGGTQSGNYDNDGATAAGAIAIGVSSSATGNGSIAIGGSYTYVDIGGTTQTVANAAYGNNAIAFGSGNVASGTNAVFIGVNNSAYRGSATSTDYAHNDVVVGINNSAGNNTGAGGSVIFGRNNMGGTTAGFGGVISSEVMLGIGNQTNLEGAGGFPLAGATAVGYKNIADARQGGVNQPNVALGALNRAVSGGTGNNAQESALGVHNDARGTDASAVGADDSVYGKYSHAFGSNNQVGTFGTAKDADGYLISSADAANGTAIGNGNVVTGNSSIAVGTGNIVSGANSGAIGDPSTVTGTGSYSFGNNNTIVANNAFVVGSGVTIAAGLDGSVALGNGTTVDAAHTGSYVIAGSATPAAGIPTATTSVVSVGAAGAERQITNVAAGTLSATSTDAINGSQLFATNQAVTAAQTHYYSVNDNGIAGGNYGNDGATGIDAIAIGVNAVASADNSAAIGAGSEARGVNSFAAGNGAIANDVNDTVVGMGAMTTFGGGNTALGNNANAGSTAGNDTAVGNNASSVGGASVAIGNNTAATAAAGVAIGSNAAVHFADDVALGSGSEDLRGAQTNYAAYGLAAPQTSLGEVNVGNRQITGVAAGSDGADAVNVSQLKALAGVVDANQIHYFDINSTGGGNENNDGALGTDSIAIGKDASTSATATNALALGAGAIAQGGEAVSIGGGNSANGDGAVALGGGVANTAVGTGVLAMGNGNVAGKSSINTGTTTGAVALGSGNTAGDLLVGTSKLLSAGNGAVAIGQGDTATGLASIALGSGSSAKAGTVSTGGDERYGTVAIGYQAAATGGAIVMGSKAIGDTDSVAVGANASAKTWTVALGMGAQGFSSSVAIGKGAQADMTTMKDGTGVTRGTSSSIAIGNGASAHMTALGDAGSMIAIGDHAQVSRTAGIALGSGTSVSGAEGIAIGFSAKTSGINGAALGLNSVAAGESSLAMGNGAQATGVNSLSVGTGNVVSGDNSGAFGDPSTVSGTGSYSVGNNNTIANNNTFVVGSGVTTTQDNSVVLGNASADRAATTVTGDTINGTAYTYAGAGSAANGVVSVGGAGTERQIINVAAGQVSVDSTDAVNGSQLFAANQSIEALATDVDASAIHYVSVNDGGTKGSNYDNDGAAGTDSVAVGVNAVTAVGNGIAIGNGATNVNSGADLNAVAIGALAHTDQSYTTAIGSGSEALVQGAVALGAKASSTNAYSIAIGSGPSSGQGANAAGGGSIAIGGGGTGPTGLPASALGAHAIAIGQNTTALPNSVALGYKAAVGSASSLAIGDTASTGATGRNVAIGNLSTANANTAAGGAVAIGRSNIAFGDGAVAIGDPSYASGTGAFVGGANNIANSDGTTTATAANMANGAVAIGNGNKAIGQGSVALGNGSTAGAAGIAGNVAIGDDATAAASAGDVAIGSGSVTAKANATTGATINGVAYAFAGTAPTSVVSVGAVGAERQITNLAAGRVADDSTDAVNGSQLFATNTALDELSTTVDASATHYFSVNDNGVQGANYVNDGATGVDSLAAGVGAKATSNLDTAVGSFSSASGGSSFAGGMQANASGSSGVALGFRATSSGQFAIAIGASTGASGADAVSVGWNTKVTGDSSSAFGASSTVSGDQSASVGTGNIVAANNAFALGSNINIAAGMDGAVALGDHSTVAAATATPTGTIAGVTYNYAGGNPAAGSVVSVGAVGAERQIQKVAAGEVSDTSTDAVNGSQLFATNTALDELSTTVDASATHYFSVNDNDVQGSNYDNTGAQGADSLAAGVNAGTAAGAENAVAIGFNTIASGADSTAIGQGAATNGDFGTAIGGGSLTDATRANTAGRFGTAVGFGSQANGVGDTAMGTLSNTGAANTDPNDDSTQSYRTAVGYASSATGDAAVAAGAFNMASGARSVALGYNAQALDADSVALGSNAVTAAVNVTASTVIAGTTYNFAGAGAGVTSVVSVGSVGAERQITNVAAGRLSDTSTDAVNGSQLYATNQAVDSLSTAVGGGGIKYFHANSTDPDSQAVGLNSVAIGSNAIANNEDDIALGNGSITSAAVATTGVTIGTTDYTFAGADPTSVVSVGVLGAERQIQNVAAGRLSATSTDAVNGSQLFATNQQVTQNTADITNLNNIVSNIGSGGVSGKYFHANSTAADSQATGTDSVAIGPTSVASGNDSIAAGNGSKASGTASTAVGNGSTASGATSTAIGDGAQATNDNSVAIGSGSVTSRDNSVSVGSAGDERQITNVAAGTAETDAVNVSQLKQSEAAAQAGSVQYDTNVDGSIDTTNVTLNPGGAPTTIHNVAAGTADTDAANVGQINDAIKTAENWSKSYTDQKLDTIDKNLNEIGNRANAGVASAMAMASLPQAYQPDQSSAAVGVGSFHGESGIAVGMSTITESGHYVFKVNASTNTRGDTGVGVGAAVVW
jgi:autotransporter adhesin